MTADLLNFHTIYSRRSGDNYKVYSDRTATTYGSVTLSHNDWVIDVKERPETRNIVKNMDTYGGYALTHNITITKVHGQLFSVEEAENILEKLRLFFSFANGAWAAPFIPSGFDASNELVYQVWSAPLVDPWESRLGWFDTHNAQMLDGVFSGFCTLFSTSPADDVLKTALYWYLRSNRSSSGIDGGIILSHSALEKISTLVIESNTLKLPKVSGKPSAADKIRTASVYLNMPVGIKADSDCPFYKGMFEGIWNDIPDAINKFRNHLVHPKVNSKINALNATSDMWQLAQWLIELFILRLSGYHDVYSKRTNKDKWRGVVELVPWNEKFFGIRK